MMFLTITFSTLSFIIGAFLIKIITATRFSSTKHLLETKITVLETKLNSSDELINNLMSEKNELKNKMDVLQKENLHLEKFISELKTTIKNERISSNEKLELLTKAHQILKQEFENISNKIFDDKNSKLVEQNKLNLDLILNPLKDQIDGFKKKVEDVYDKESKERNSLKTEITSLKELNSQISKEAANLTSAIKGDKKIQGIWGEIILERVLESSGLRKGYEYQTQVSAIDTNGDKKIPDAIIYLPDGKKVIIDSKVTLNSFEEYHSANETSKKREAIKDFLNNTKNHISNLSNKRYEELKQFNTLDYVLMFIPIETAFTAILEYDQNIFEHAFKKNIILVSPTTLLVVLKTINSIWHYENQTKNSAEIAVAATNLYEKLVLFVESMISMGKSIDKAKADYNEAINRLSQGKNSAISQAEKFKTFGIKPKKTLPTDLLKNIEVTNKKDLYP